MQAKAKKTKKKPKKNKVLQKKKIIDKPRNNGITKYQPFDKADKH
jgi:hypothetical protein